MVICWFYKKHCDVNIVGIMSLALVKEQLKSLLSLSASCGLTRDVLLLSYCMFFLLYLKGTFPLVH